MTYTGDLLIRFDDGDFDLLWENGQPHMTDGFESSVMLAIFGDRNSWQNALATTDGERFVSRFPEVIARATVSDRTRNDGIEALKQALAYLTGSGAASKVTVTGSIVTAFAILWNVNVIVPTGRESRFVVNWERGDVTAGFLRAA